MDTESVISNTSAEAMDTSYENAMETDACSQSDEYQSEGPVSTKDLRKNLVLNFDNAYVNYDSAAEFESMKNKTKKPKMLKKSQKNTGAKSRPPKAPVMHIKTSTKRSHDVVKNQELNGDSKPLMSVYLRVRPPVAPDTKEPNSEVNTIEIIPSDGKSSTFTSIRTYPPVTSNAAKSHRNGNKRNLATQNNRSAYSKDITSCTCETNTDNDQSVTGVKEYEFNQVFEPDSSQKEIYECIAEPLVEGLFPTSFNNKEAEGGQDKVAWKSPCKKKAKSLDGTALASPRSFEDGKSALLFAYGITNAGKTHTIIGETSDKKGKKTINSSSLKTEAGILPRALKHMLAKIEDATENDSNNIYLMHMSYLEIYNENIFDLLASEKSQQQNGYESSSSMASSNRITRSKAISNSSLRLREDCNGHIFVQGLSKHPISSVAEGIKLANIAKDKRHTSSNNINIESSRSHCVCQLELTIIPKNQSINGNESSTSSYFSTNMWIVDLAGIERSKRTGTMYRSTRQKEASLINASLMNLMRCLQTMSNNQKHSTTSNTEIIPFRESKLTHLFMNHLTGASASQTSMIINVNPAAADYDETQHVLSYGAVARTVKITKLEYINKFRKVAGLSQSTEYPKRISDEKMYESSGPKSPRQKVASIVNKLSPRALMKKKREKRAAARAKAKATMNGSEKRVVVKKLTKSEYTKNIENLRDTIKELREENSSLRDEVLVSKEDQIRRDSEMRMEVVNEMENEIREIREHYESMSRKNKIPSNPTPMKTIKALETERREQFIQELMEKNDECEDEMARMSERHAKELNRIQQSHEDELNCKNEEIYKLKKLHIHATKEDKEKIQSLEAELSKTKRSYNLVKKEHESLLAFVEHDSFDNEGNDVMNDIVQDDKENVETKAVKKSGHRRLPRNRHSEVACADVPVGKRALRSQNAI